MSEPDTESQSDYDHDPPTDPGATATRWVKRNDTRIKKVINLLEANLGIPRHSGKRSGLQVLVLTILSQNTTDPNALQAYENLLENYANSDSENDSKTGRLPRNDKGEIDTVRIRMSQAADVFPSPEWNEMIKASHEEIENAISVCGLQKSKTATIKRVLEWVRDECDEFSLEAVIGDLEPTEATKKLSEIKGIGLKTAAVTLMEADRVDVCPVDTHVHRVTQRLGLVEETSSRTKTFRDLQPLIPGGKGHSFHHNLLTFGRTICTAQNPDCENCFLQTICPYYRKELNQESLNEKIVN